MLDSLSGIVGGLRDFGNALGDFARGLNDRNTWLRVALVILGILLVLAAFWPS